MLVGSVEELIGCAIVVTQSKARWTKVDTDQIQFATEESLRSRRCKLSFIELSSFVAIRVARMAFQAARVEVDAKSWH